MTPDWRQQLLAAYNPLLMEQQALNQTEKTMADVIFEACSQRNEQLEEQLEEQFRNRCNALVGTALDESANPAEVGNALFRVGPEQLLVYGLQATRTMASNINVVNTSVLGRLQTLHAGLDSVRFAGVQLYQDGQPLRGGNAGSEAFGKLGVWLNGSYHLGEVDSTRDVKGFTFKNWSVTAGADYKILESVVVGGAFTYITSDNDFKHKGGESDNDSYIGSLYGSFYPIENLYVDVLGTYGHINFDIDRKISYRLASSTDPDNFDVVNTKAKGDTDGRQWGLTLSTGYNFHWQSVKFTPYARFSYLKLDIDNYRERGGQGWALRFDSQDIESMKSIVGGRLAYAISLPWGVVVPQARGEWHHEFRDPSRTIKASFVGDPLGQKFSIFVPHPDEDYAIFGGDLTATFAQGISAFVGYEALVGYDRISSHRVTLGARVQF
ncbi:autotransporter outer membrane beta-barrel domain-containing protein [Methylomarinovum caldicuralii]|uniref:autotransporter outer membrane beta-barrel domain-containing protein n=1 Tax=Methylomarinovum caldicuralii TaxID=438856 RepID=UPI002954C922|nr:autotransporter outer membrane beta-barrel domain-containing protein [Methylomarinovum caldicuralii]